MKTTRWATRRANPISCVTTIIVIPSFARSVMTSRTSLIISGSSAEVGSSKSMILGCIAGARDRDALLLAAREGRGIVSRLVRDADPLEERAGGARRVGLA